MPAVVIVTARDEAPRIGATLDALAAAFPQSTLLVADDGSRDATATIAAEHGAEVMANARPRGKGQAASAAAIRALEFGGQEAMYLFCDADLGASAVHLNGLVSRLRAGQAPHEVVVGAFAVPAAAGFGFTVGFARRLLRRRGAGDLLAPLSGQRALRGGTLAAVLPFAPRFGMEVGMTLDVLRAGGGVVEVELPLEHRATKRDASGFLHRGRQFVDLVLVACSRR